MNQLARLASVLALAASVAAPGLYAADTPQKHEMRSAWVATVWKLDWPTTTISSTGNTTQINKQKQELTTLLDSLAINNLNAVNFQVRSRCDAMYKSSYEPWSSDLVSTRGMDPGYDPLAFCVEECHKRGMECHAWLNPYRYESVKNQWDGTPNAYRKDHPDWILDVGDASILNPAKAEVTQRICDIITEILKNYDVDGVLFDDYFYLSGTGSADAADYSAYTAGGGKLALGDWRRDNVNKMVKAVYSTIKKVKPWVRFGISPAGIACTSSSVAKKYGIDPCPTGSDWQYNDIYSDPIAWLNDQSLDFISPQIYWTIGYSTDYDKAAKWWSQVANKFGRHFYSSHSISSLTGSSKAPAMEGVATGIEQQIQTLASGTNADKFSEFADQIRLNRKYTENDAPGSIFYSCKYLYKTAPKFAHYLKTTVFNTPAILPPMTWQPQTNPGSVSNVTKNGSTLSWTGLNNVRYTVYAVPTSVPVSNFNKEVEYLLGTSYATSYTLPQNKLSGYNYCVCVLDRYGNEYTPVFVGASAKTLAAPTLVSPAEGAKAEMPFDFTWNSVANAGSYIVEIAEDAAMTKLISTAAVNGTSVCTDQFSGIPVDKTIYWRVRACGNNYNDGISASRSVVPRLLVVSSPEEAATGVSLTPTVKFSYVDRAINVEIAADSEFKDIVVSGAATRGSYTVPKYKLTAATTYWVRGHYTLNGSAMTTAPVSFTTLEMTPDVPVITFPTNGGTLHADEVVKFNPIEGAKGIRLEICNTTAFPSRSSYISEKIDMNTWADTNTGADIKISSKNLTDGATYYARAYTKYNTLESTSVKTGYGDVVTFVYSAQKGGVNDIVADGDTEISYADGVLTTSGVTVVVDALGREVARVNGTASLSLQPGVYVARSGNQVMKFMVK